MYGMKVHTAVFEAHEEFSGPTIHFVNAEYDKGNIITQTKVEIKDVDTPDTISKKFKLLRKFN